MLSCFLCDTTPGSLKRWLVVRDVWINYNKNTSFLFSDVKTTERFMFLTNIGSFEIFENKNNRKALILECLDSPFFRKNVYFHSICYKPNNVPGSPSLWVIDLKLALLIVWGFFMLLCRFSFPFLKSKHKT